MEKTYNNHGAYSSLYLVQLFLNSKSFLIDYWNCRGTRLAFGSLD